MKEEAMDDNKIISKENQNENENKDNKIDNN